ncbi:hypothetical protein Ct9H90mP29_10740 [bacterium]|nr:MAG: hypothetical protein Ct9H90mP29_10740 [bacterium]
MYFSWYSWAWLMSSLMLPAIISTKDWDPLSKAISQASIFENFKTIANLVVRYPRYVFSSGSFFGSSWFNGAIQGHFDVNVASFFKPGTEIRDSMDFMDKEMRDHGP